MKTDRKKALELLTDAWNRIADQEHWCQGSYATNYSDNYVDPLSPCAIRWCSRGSMILSRRKMRYYAPGLAYQELTKAAQEMGYNGMTECNDQGTHEDIVLMFKTAVHNLKNGEDNE